MTDGVSNNTLPELKLVVVNDAGQTGEININQSNDVSIMSVDKQEQTTVLDILADDVFSEEEYALYNETFNEALLNYIQESEYAGYDIDSIKYTNQVGDEYEYLVQGGMDDELKDEVTDETTDEAQAEETDNTTKRNLTSEEIAQLDRSQRQEILKDLFPEEVWETMNKPYGIDPSDKFMSAVQVDENGRYYIDLTSRDLRPNGLKNPWNIMNELYNGDGKNNADKAEEFPTWYRTAVGTTTVSKDWEILLSQPLISRNADGYIEVSEPDTEGNVVVGNGINNETVHFTDPNIAKDENGVYKGEAFIEGSQETMYAVVSKKDGVATVSYYSMSDVADGVLNEGAKPVITTVHNKDNSTVRTETNSNNEVVRTATAADGQNLVVEYGADEYADKVTVNGNETYILNGTKWYLESNPNIEANIQVSEDGTVKINNTQEINDRLITRTYGPNGALSELAVGDKTFDAQNAVFENGVLKIDIDNSDVDLVVDSENGIYMQDNNGVSMLVNTKALDQTSETNAKIVQDIFDDAFNEKNGWTKAGEGYVRSDGNAIYNIKQDGDNVVVTNDTGYKTVYNNNIPVAFYFPEDSNPQEVTQVPGEENTYEINGLKYEVNESGMLVEKTIEPQQSQQLSEVNLNGQTLDLSQYQFDGKDTYTQFDSDTGVPTHQVKVDGNDVYVYSLDGQGSWVKFENGIPTKTKFNGFERKLEIDSETGKMYTTHFGTRLNMVTIDEKGSLTEVDNVLYDGKQYYVVESNTDGTRIVEDLNGKKYKCEVAANGEIINMHELLEQ